MPQLRRGIDRILSGVIGLALMVIFLLNMYQVGGRYLFGIGSAWIPDLTRLLFIWMVFLGTALMHQRKGHLVIDFVLLRFPPILRRLTETTINVAMLFIAGVLVMVGGRITRIRMEIPYTGLEIPTGYAYLAVPICGLLMLLTGTCDLWERWHNVPEKSGARGERI